MTHEYGDELTYAEAMQIVNDMLLVCQKLKSNFAETLGGLGWDKEIVDAYAEEEMAWLSGQQDIVPLLADLSMGIKPLTGMGLCNLMYISHKSMNGLIAAIAPLRLPEGRDLPEPNFAWATLGEITKED